MQILVLNSGSSSIKFQLFKMPEAQVICSGLVERIGLNDSQITYTSGKGAFEKTLAIKTHKQGLELVAAYIMSDRVGVVASASDIQMVGHRVVHGGNAYADTVIITEEVKQKIEELSSLAPLHNPANLQGILVAEAIFSEAKQIAVFDTAFHQTIPVKAYKYAIPNTFLDQHHIRLYGFHGTSHKYVAAKAIQYLNREHSKIITIHLGNGCSMTAVKNGKSIDHTLGFAPMNGLIMGTRSGDIDPAVIFYMINALGYTVDEVYRILQKNSGMLGLTGYSDLRDIEAKANEGDRNCKLALTMNAYRIQKFIGSYAAVMNGLDAIVFTAGIGENSDHIRSLVCKELDFLGIEMDSEKNKIRSKEIRDISSSSSRVNVLVIPTNEELEIAQQSYALISK
ncbi:acetate kinase [Aquimarina sp. U1-2]|uniref:acetate/propionate family kinase n=1 Tax=Aquimarina sp. U1-2 TaxID=2823141 RepID=UPI001AEC8BEE|nr:acetate kinase [Aquimarina sp. U1-2]MBP2832779.1 acetate kinase [Aquimarina sp. U1-2]